MPKTAIKAKTVENVIKSGHFAIVTLSHRTLKPHQLKAVKHFQKVSGELLKKLV